MDDLIKKNVTSIQWIRDELKEFDDYCKPIMGMSDFDDAVILDFEGRLVASSDGPYDKRLVLKSALVHAATDVVVKGAKPIFALDNLYGSEEDVSQMLIALKIQAKHMGISILGGNTKIEEETPSASITIFGKLLLDEPIRDRGAIKGDVIALFGAPIWGEMELRLVNAKLMFDTWFEALSKVRINSAKDVTKGGLACQAYEMEAKSKTKFELNELDFSLSRNLDNFLITLEETEFEKLKSICDRTGCPLQKIGKVT